MHDSTLTEKATRQYFLGTDTANNRRVFVASSRDNLRIADAEMCVDDLDFRNDFLKDERHVHHSYCA